MEDKGSKEYSAEDIPAGLKKDELDDYLKYQDEVMNENDKAFNELIEIQEERLARIEEKEEGRTKDLYDIPDKMTPIDEALQKRIEERDRAISERIQVLDERTDQFEKVLEKAIAEKKEHLAELGHHIADRAREAEKIRRQEREIQKDINKRQRNGVMEVWDQAEETAVTGEKVSKETEETGEILIEETEGAGRPEKAREAEKSVEEAAGGKEKISRQEKIRDYGRERKRAKKHDETRWKAEETRREKEVRRQTTTKTAGVAEAIPVRAEAVTPVKKKARTQRIPAAAGAHGQTPRCPVCGNPLVWYEKYQRWWCRKCKKWR